MTITNNTQHETVNWTVSGHAGVECGNLSPGDDMVMPAFDNQPKVKVTLVISKTGDETEVIIEDSGL